MRTRCTISFPPLAIVPPQFAIASKKGGRRTWGPIENNSLPTWKRPSPAPFNYRAASARLHLLFSGQESWHSSLRSSSLCARMAPVALSPSQFIRFFPIIHQVLSYKFCLSSLPVFISLGGGTSEVCLYYHRGGSTPGTIMSPSEKRKEAGKRKTGDVVDIVVPLLYPLMA